MCRRLTLLLGALFTVSILLCVLGGVTGCRAVTLAGSEAFYYLLGLLIYSRSPLFGAYLVSVVALASSATVLAKTLLRLPRPPVEAWLTAASGPGFPSGHSAVSAAFLVASVLALCGGRRCCRVSLGLAVGFSAVIGYTRLVLGVHYARDVVGGLVAGWVSGAAGWRLAAEAGPGWVLPLLAPVAMLFSSLAFLSDPGYASAARLAGVSLGLVAASPLLVHIGLYRYPRRLHVPALCSVATASTSLLVLLLALAVERLIATPYSSLAGFAVFAFYTLSSWPLLSLLLPACRQGAGRRGGHRPAPVQ